jgi:hypothetical protein
MEILKRIVNVETSTLVSQIYYRKLKGLIAAAPGAPLSLHPSIVNTVIEVIQVSRGSKLNLLLEVLSTLMGLGCPVIDGAELPLLDIVKKATRASTTVR